ncbi:hypothetical protein DFJ58DRAFT_16692 [Suillus subalutaceus]|uniref:uncharacterized protein n=1 Tax=Suillus subalutaceus TaxID=48586 RepID=UPI001B8705C4|nr:uncharacterized protein DFJ58DRAFT_16692 [Suillus subalutaceus]KAG1878075.1 hypothetical protein DFJ58DRAFT_16692 [Suillus subalutaceus]
MLGGLGPSCRSLSDISVWIRCGSVGPVGSGRFGDQLQRADNSQSAANFDMTIECRWAVGESLFSEECGLTMLLQVRLSFSAKETSGGWSELPAKPRGHEGKQSLPDAKKMVLMGAKTVRIVFQVCMACSCLLLSAVLKWTTSPRTSLRNKRLCSLNHARAT